MATGDGQTRGRHPRARDLDCSGVGRSTRQHLKLIRDHRGLGRGDQQPVEAGVTDHAGVLHLDGDPATDVDLHRRRGVGRIPCQRHIQCDRQVGLDGVTGSLGPTRADLLLSGENRVQIMGDLGVLQLAQELDQHDAAAAIIQVGVRTTHCPGW